MVKRFPKKIFYSTFIITVIIFLGGLLLGYGLDNLRTDSIADSLRLNELDTESYLVEQDFWETFAGDDCRYAEERLNSISVQLVELGQYLTNYEEKSLFEGEEFEYLARRYFLLEIQAYTLVHELQETCALENDVILFFYDSSDSESITQGYVLDRIVDNANGTVDVFSISVDFEEDAAVESIKLYYDVTSAPTIIINDEVKKEGYVSYDELRELIDATF